MSYILFFQITEWKKGQNPLHLAAELGRDDMLKQLLQLGVDPNAYMTTHGRLVDYETALHRAMGEDRVEAVKILIKAGAKEYLKVRGNCNTMKSSI